jgi:hypothetical protein
VEAIVAPHSGAGNFTGREFKFTADGKEYTYPLSTNFESGKVYNFTLTLMPQVPFAPPLDTSDGLSNCYMVKPGKNVTIPITRAITIGGMSADAAATVHVLWDDNSVVSIPTDGQLTGSGASRTFTVDATNTFKQGNAVVALKGINGTIYWSWHIWVSNYDGQTWTNNGFTFMDRNLGATANTLSLAGRGLLYQYCRKDPFPGGKSGTAGFAALDKFIGMLDVVSTVDADKLPKYVTNTTNDEAGMVAGILESIRKPTTFFSEIASYQWIPHSTSFFWLTSSYEKSVYDPCPLNWKLPQHIYSSGAGVNEWPFYNAPNQTTWSPGDSGGCTWKTAWPAAGYRSNNGELNFVGESSMVWVASATATFLAFSRRFMYDNESINWQSACGRNWALSVKCVKE